MPLRLSHSQASRFQDCAKSYETHNFSYLVGLIEEAQSMGIKMEARLWDQKDFIAAKEEHEKLKVELKELKKEKKVLKSDE